MTKKTKKKQLYYINEGKGMMTKKRKRKTLQKITSWENL